MIIEFEPLDREEQDLMYRIPFLVAALISGADNHIDKAEINKAVSISNLKKSNARKSLIEYYGVVNMDFEDKLKVLIQSLPGDTQKRNEQLIQELERLNDIFPKLDREFAVDFHASITDLAKKIAQASGGVLGYMAVGYEESKLIGLDMIKAP